MSDAEMQVETPAPDANASPQAEEPKGSEAESSPAVKKPDDNTETVNKVQSRFDELTRNWREAERREKALLELLARDRQDAPKAPATDDRPQTLADFEFDEAKYQAHLFSEAEKRAVAAAEKRLKEQEDRERVTARQTQFQQRESKFAKSVPDYHEVTRNQDLPVNAAMAEVIAESEDGPALAYYLGKNLSIAEQIARMSPLGAARELGRIEIRLANERDRAKEKSVSKTPPPPPKIDAAGDPVVEKDPKDWTDAEFAKWRKRHASR